MADNVIYEATVTVAVPVPSGTVSGDPVVIGGIKGVALTDRDTDGNATVHIGPASVARISVLATAGDDDSPIVGSTVSLGDALYKNASSTLVSKDTGGGLLGYALGTRDSNGVYGATPVASGATGDCDVLLA
jgi:Uncharacterized conserved protein (DUF2190)